MEDCPVARALQAWSNAQRKALGGAINMDIKLLDLLEALKSHSKSSGRFPQTPKALGDKIRRIAPALRKCGLECTAGRKIGGVLLWNFRQHDEETMIP